MSATLSDPPAWEGSSSDPNDEQFGDVVERVSLDAADKYAAVLVGEPYDGAVIGRPGAGEGPAAIRTQLAATKTHHFGHGPVSSVGDLGDVIPPEGSVREVQQTIEALTERVQATDALAVFLGGDNSLTVPNARPLLSRGTLGVVNFDAHLDCREVRDEPTSGTPYRQLFEAGLDAYAVVGARHFETSTAYADYVRDQGGTIVTAETAGRDPLDAAERALDAMDDVDRVYASVDLDVLDAAFAPGVSAPTPGGLASRELFAMVRRIAEDERLAGFEVVECAPPLEGDDRTASAAARTIAHFLGGMSR